MPHGPEAVGGDAVANQVLLHGFGPQFAGATAAQTLAIIGAVFALMRRFPPA